MGSREIIESISAKIVDIPQKVVFETARGRSEVSHAIIVSLAIEGGPTGLGEATPAEYVTGENRESVLADIAAANEAFKGQPFTGWRAFSAKAREVTQNRCTASAGLEIAALDLYCRLNEVSAAGVLGGATDHVISDITIPIVAPDLANTLAREAAEDYTSLKIKVGGTLDADVERVRQIHNGAPQAALRVDANQGYTPEGAVEFVREVEKQNIHLQLLEQPVAKEDIAGLRHVRERVDTPVIADESAVDAASVLKLIREDAVDGVNIKLMKAGITGALDIVSLCRAAGLKLMIGCMLESPVGIGAGVHVACGTGAFSYLDLDGDVLGKPTGMEQNYVREGERLTPIHPG